MLLEVVFIARCWDSNPSRPTLKMPKIDTA
jgi:hypothetical protein